MVINMAIQYLPLNDPFNLGLKLWIPTAYDLVPTAQRPKARTACAFRFSAHARAAFLALAPAMAGMMTEIRDFQLEKTWVCHYISIVYLLIYIFIHLLMLLVSYHTYTYIYIWFVLKKRQVPPRIDGSICFIITKPL